MLMFFQGPYRAAARAILGIIVLVIALVLHQIVLTIIGAVLIVWGAANAVSDLRRRRQERADSQAPAAPEDKPRNDGP